MAALNNIQIDQAIQQLLNASDPEEAGRLLRAYPWLTSIEMYLRLTEIIASKRHECDLWGIADLMACRGLLRRCRSQGMDAVLAAQPGWPLYTQGPLTQLLALAGNASADLRIEKANAALDDVDLESESDIYGLVCYNLGLGYQTKADADSNEMLARAMEYFETAKREWQKENSLFGKRFLGRAQHNLGRLCLQRRHGDRSQDIETALSWFQQAYETFGKEAAELLNVFILMGDAYLNRIRGERLHNIEQGIHYYEKAYHLAEESEPDRRLGDIEHNLSVAYRMRLHGHPADNYEQARELAERALTRFDRRASPEDWARTAGELATIYGHRQRGNRDKNLEKAIEYARQVLAIYNPQDHPYQWTLAQLTLGNLYCDRISGVRAENDRRAIRCFQAILNRCDNESDPVRWAEAMNNLGTVYAGRSTCRFSANYRKAIKCFRQALEMRKPEAIPAQALQTASNWGNLDFRFGNWAKASGAFQIALKAGKALYQASSTEAGRRAELAETSRLYARAAYCLLRMGHPDQALLQLEQGKARLLAEALALGDTDLNELLDSQRQAILSARQVVHELEAEMRLSPDTLAGRGDRDLVKELQQTRTNLDRLIKTIRAEQPDFMPTGLDLPGILAHIPEGGALVAPLVTSQGSAVFVLPDGIRKVRTEHVISLKAFTDDNLNAILVGSEEKPGWLHTYLTYLNKKQRAPEVSRALKAGQATPEAWQVAFEMLQEALEKWKATIEAFTEQLWDALMGPVHERLVALELAEGAPVTLMPQGGLGLLPLHAAWCQFDGVKRAFLDDYTVTYAPSAYALSVSYRRLHDEHRHQPALLTVVNPTGDLPYTPIEGEIVKALFSPMARRTLVESEATQEDVVKAAQGRTYLHFACHGFYNWHDVMRSGLVLAGDAPFTLAEIISSLDLNTARLVTLSACETGLTEFQQSPDEYIGLPAGFLQAGAPGVISTLWAVNDISTALLMGRFYLYHRKGDPDCQQVEPLSPARALRRAQQWLRDVTARELAAHFEAERQEPKCLSYAQAQALWIHFDQKDLDSCPFDHPVFWAPLLYQVNSVEEIRYRKSSPLCDVAEGGKCSSVRIPVTW